MNEIEFLEFVINRIDYLMKDLHEDSLKFSTLKTLKDDIEERLESIDYRKEHESKRLPKLLKKYNFTESEKALLRCMDRWSTIGYELCEPIDEYENTNYFCRRESFANNYDGEINYGYTIYKWDGTYSEKQLAPSSPETFKFKNWQEVFHCLSPKKSKPKDFMESFIKEMDSNEK